MARKKRESEQLKAFRILAAHNRECGMPFFEAVRMASEDLPDTLRFLGIKTNA
jgi:hypothetical protein